MHKQTQITLIRHHGQIYIYIYTKSCIIYDLALMKFASHSEIYFSVFFHGESDNNSNKDRK